MRKLPVFKPTSRRSSSQNMISMISLGICRRGNTICEDRLDLRLVPWLELNNRLSAEGGQHCYCCAGKALCSYYPRLVDHGLAMVAATTPISCPKTADDVHAMLPDVER